MTAGVLYMGAMRLYLGALQTEDVSIVAPLFQVAPIFASGLSYLVLGEVLTRTQLIGGLAIVSGAISLSWQGRGRSFKMHQPRIVC